MCHAGPYRGDQIVILPRFELNQYLDTVERYKIGTLYVVSFLTASWCLRDVAYHFIGAPYHYCNVKK